MSSTGFGQAEQRLTMIVGRQVSQQPLGLPGIVGKAPQMRSLCLTIRQIAPSDTTVLIRGEPGTGKRLVASAIHSLSRRAAGPFVEVHCAMLGEDILERKLFGYEDGAFPGTVSSRAGCIQEAEGGTLFLHEIRVLSPGAQIKLLRLLQEREYELRGGNQTARADVRVIAATGQDPEAAADRENPKIGHDGGGRLAQANGGAGRARHDSRRPQTAL
jgi:Nif-specific regulatory protein